MKCIAIVGSRSLMGETARQEIHRFVKRLDPDKTIVVSGGAFGPDNYAEEACKKFGVGILVFRPKPPGNVIELFARNERIVKYASHLIAWWDGESRGTKHSIGLAKRRGLKVKIMRRK